MPLNSPRSCPYVQYLPTQQAATGWIQLRAHDSRGALVWKSLSSLAVHPGTPQHAPARLSTPSTRGVAQRETGVPPSEWPATPAMPSFPSLRPSQIFFHQRDSEPQLHHSASPHHALTALLLLPSPFSDAGLTIVCFIRNGRNSIAPPS